MRKRDKRRLTPSEQLTEKRKRATRVALQRICEGLVPIFRKYVTDRSVSTSIPEMQFSNGASRSTECHAPVIILTFDRYPSRDQRAKIANAITSGLPVGHVSYNTSVRLIRHGAVHFHVPIW